MQLRPQGADESAPHRRDDASGIGQKTVINLVALLALCTYTALRADPFLSSTNLLNILSQIAIVVMIGSAMTLLLVSGAFDLSVGGVVALSGCVSAYLSLNGYSVPISFAGGTPLVSPSVSPTASWSSGSGINSFIATIGTMYVCRGLALLLTGGVALSGMPDDFSKPGNAYFGSVPALVPMMLAFVLVFAAIQKWTVLGRHAVASGSNAEAAFLAACRSSAPSRCASRSPVWPRAGAE